jgi:hypothetical protein
VRADGRDGVGAVEFPGRDAHDQVTIGQVAGHPFNLTTSGQRNRVSSISELIFAQY